MRADSGTATFDNAAAGNVQGGPGAGYFAGNGVRTGGQSQIVSNAGTVGALSDRAVQFDHKGLWGIARFTNTGTVLGSVTALESATTLDNAGQWNLRSFADADGDGVRETLAIAVSDLGTSGANVVNNGGTLALLTHDGTATTLDTTGMYLPFGNANNTVALNSPPTPPSPFCVGDACPRPLPIIRPEVGAYLGNQVAAIGMFRHTLHDRLGEVDFAERQRREDGGPVAAWARVQSGQFDTTAGRTQVDLSSETTLAQVGAEITRWTQSDQRFHLGAMLGWGQADTDARSIWTGYRAKGKVEGTLVGLYGTWYQSAAEATGLYVDSWVQYGDFRNRVQGELLPVERYDSTAWAISIEAGYAFELAQGANNAYFLEPQLQVIHSEYDDDEHREINGTVVRSEDSGGLTTRLGARVYARPLQPDRMQPFVEANWWHHDGHESFAFNQHIERLERSADTYELKIGAQAELGSRWTGWMHIAYRNGDGDYRDLEGLLGAKYGW